MGAETREGSMMVAERATVEGSATKKNLVRAELLRTLACLRRTGTW